MVAISFSGLSVAVAPSTIDQGGRSPPSTKCERSCTSSLAAHRLHFASILGDPWLVVGDTRKNVADILVDPNGDRVRDHWDRTAHALLVGLILHVLYAETDKTLRGCVHLLTDPVRQVDDTLTQMLSRHHDRTGQQGWRDPLTNKPTQTHPLVASAVRALLDKSPNERSGVLSTALSFLDLYRDPIVAANTATSDFRLTDLVNSERPVSLYLTVPPSDLSRTRPLVRMILNQALRRLTESMHFEDGRAVAAGRHPLLLMLDAGDIYLGPP